MSDPEITLWNQSGLTVSDQPARFVAETPLESVVKNLKAQVTDDDIFDDPDHGVDNPTFKADGFPIFNKGYGPGRQPLFTIPEGGFIKFLTKSSRNSEGGSDWLVQGRDSKGNPIGVGTISTYNRRGSIITIAGKDGVKRKTYVFRSKYLIR